MLPKDLPISKNVVELLIFTKKGEENEIKVYVYVGTIWLNQNSYSPMSEVRFVTGQLNENL